MKNIVIGIDGGSTKSHMAMYDSTGKCIGTALYGPLNHETMKGSYAELEERLSEFALHVLREAGATVDNVKHAVFGLSGVDSDGQQILISDIVRRIGFEDFTVCNDAFLAVAGACPDCVGVGAINGTGFKLAAVDHSGVEIHTCGLGGFTEDQGGGGWYGGRASSAVYNEMYRVGRPSTIMRKMIFELLGITRNEEYLEVLTEKLYDPNSDLDRVALNSVVFNAALQGDEAALGILDDSARSYADAIAWLALNMDFPVSKTLHVSLAGSVFVKQKVKVLHELIAKRVAEMLPGREVEFILMEAPPVAGAAMWAAQKAGFKIDMEAINAGIAHL